MVVERATNRVCKTFHYPSDEEFALPKSELILRQMRGARPTLAEVFHNLRTPFPPDKYRVILAQASSYETLRASYAGLFSRPVDLATTKNATEGGGHREAIVKSFGPFSSR